MASEILKHRLENGYTEFRVVAAANDPLPFPTLCVACGTAQARQKFAKSQRFTVKKTDVVGTLEGDSFLSRDLSGEVSLCRECALPDVLPNDFIQFGLSGSPHVAVVIQIGNPNVAEVFRETIQPYAEAVKAALQKRAQRVAGRLRLDFDFVLTEKRFLPTDPAWKPPMGKTSLLGGLFGGAAKPKQARWSRCSTAR
jgi:hypothetical protein